MDTDLQSEVWDYVIIGSGFGGSISAMRLVEKGYSVLVLERGKQFRDQDFPRSNWNVAKFLWLPALRCFGILQITPLRDVLVLHGSGVGGGSLGYANVLMSPSDQLFENPSWSHLADWKQILKPHYDTARRMLGVAANPWQGPADFILREIAQELGKEDTFQTATVGVYFGEPADQHPGEEGKRYPDPYFGGEGPARSSCIHCGGCMVGCRYNAKNTLVKNYLYLAEKWGAQVWPECEARDVRPLSPSQPDGARYEVIYRKATAWLRRPEKAVRAKNVIFSASALGTLGLLYRCRDVTRSLPHISRRLGEMVRTNSESLLGAGARNMRTDYSKGIAITSLFHADEVTTIEPVRYPAGSGLMRYLASPLVDSGSSVPLRLLKTLAKLILLPLDTLFTHILPGWAQRTTILLVMQTEDNRIRLRLGRSLFTLFRQGLVSQPDQAANIPSKIDIGHWVTRRFARQINGIPAGSVNEAALNIPMTAHILGGVPFGLNDQDGVIGLDCQIHHYPGLYVVDGSIVPANPGINPSLTIAALAEYAMSQVSKKPGSTPRPPTGIQPL